MIEYGNNKIQDSESDLNYLIKDLTLTNAIDLSYTRDSAGNIEAVSNTLNPIKNQTFIYDDVYRLTEASGPYGENTYTYDKAGNRETKNKDSINEIYNYTTGTNQLEQIAGTETKNYTYNANGSINSVDLKQYFYNLNERLIKVTDDGDTLGEYGYNYHGQRTHKTVNNNTTVFHYNIFGNLISETKQDGTLLKEYIYLENNPLVMIVYGPEEYDSADIDQDNDVDGKDIAAFNGTNLLSLAAGFGQLYNPAIQTYYYHNNHLGTPIMLTDDNGQTVWQADYSPFGSVNMPVNTVENNLRFPGQYYDQETGLHYNYHRYYDPDTGRYLTPDPIGLAGGINPFVYSNNNPINFIDPLGLETIFTMNTLGGGGFIVSGSLGTATARSKSVNGKYYEAKYRVVSVGFTAGVKIFGQAQPVFDIVSSVLKNTSSGIAGNQFTIDANYPPSYTSYLDIEGHSAAFFGEAKLADIKVGTYKGGRADVKPFSFRQTGAFGLQLFKFEGVHFIRIGEPKEIFVCDE